MIHCIFLGLAIPWALPATAIANDYVLRVETIGYVDKPAAESKPKETVLRAIEVVARQDSTFYGKVNIGKHTLLLAGELRATENGEFRVRIRHFHSLDTGVTIPIPNGKPKRLLDMSDVDSLVTVALGKPITIGEIQGSKQEATSGQKRRHTRTNIRYVLVLNRCKPSSERKDAS